MKYYELYEKRYKQSHQVLGKAWSEETPDIIFEVLIEKYTPCNNPKILEIGCGEGSNAIHLLSKGYNLFASDVSPSAIKWCKSKAESNYFDENRFFTLDILNNNHDESYDIVIANSVIHMFVLQEDRDKFYNFIFNHLNPKGIAIISSMGDGVKHMSDDDLHDLFGDIILKDNQEFERLPCRIVNKENFLGEITKHNFAVLDYFIENSISGFNSSMLAVIEKQNTN